jgi:hypothetical protein
MFLHSHTWVHLKMLHVHFNLYQPLAQTLLPKFSIFTLKSSTETVRWSVAMCNQSTSSSLVLYSFNRSRVCFCLNFIPYFQPYPQPPVHHTQNGEHPTKHDIWNILHCHGDGYVVKDGGRRRHAPDNTVLSLCIYIRCLTRPEAVSGG